MTLSIMTHEHKKQILSSLLAAALVMFVLCQAHAGFAVVFVLLIQFIWLPYSIVIAIAEPKIRRLQLTRVAIWVGAVAIIVAVHYIRHEVTRRNANEIVASINNYTAQHGHCPATTDDIGITREELKSKLGFWSYYECKGGKQTFFYGVTYAPFETYDYDFAGGTWDHQWD